MLVSDVLRTKGHHVVRIHPADSVELAVHKLAEHRIGALVVGGSVDETARHFLGAGLHQRDVPRRCRWRSRMLLGVGLPLLFLPTLTASYDGVPFGKTDRASALLSAARNIGGSIGISLANNVLKDRDQFHQSMLVGQAIPSSAQYQDTLHQMTNYFVAGQLAVGRQASGHPMDRTAGAGEGVVPRLHGVLWILMVISLAAVPLALALRKSKLGGAAAMGH